MSGHNKFSKIKHKKAKTDAQKSKVFSKFAKLITQEARNANGNLESASLKAAIARAKEANMPSDNIDRAVKKADSDTTNMEPITYEAYGPGGAAIVIETLTDNRNRTAAEIKHLLSENNISAAEPGSAAWAFEKKDGQWIAQTTVPVSEEDAAKTESIVEALEEHDDVQGVYTNIE